MGDFGSALVNVLLLLVAMGLLMALFGLPGLLCGFALVALAFTVGNVGAVGLLTALLGALVVLLVIGMTTSLGEDPRRDRTHAP